MSSGYTYVTQKEGDRVLKSCKYCGRIHDRKHDCGQIPKRQKRSTSITKFRSGGSWQKKRNTIINLDKGLCVACKKLKIYTYSDLEVHHIVPLSEDWDLRLEEDNLITLCEGHHDQADRGLLTRKHLKRLIQDRYSGDSTPGVM